MAEGAKQVASVAAPALQAAATHAFHARAQAFCAALMAASSATRALEAWCAAHSFSGAGASPWGGTPTLVADLVSDASASIPDGLRQRLQLGDSDPVSYRRVRLSCNGLVLSDACNWFAPQRLDAAMNHRLTATNEPFGRVVTPLAPRRRVLDAHELWRDATDDAEAAEDAEDAMYVLRLRAIVSGEVSGERLPLAEVVENYHRNALALSPLVKP